ncbi:type VII secretion system-associated protein [Lentzea sp. NPDC058436]|uniref:type VII secretion system-associated protein n=1 Tax=Lentzea sp. NPDC058436 TaxID=3346499 RepID=UPI00365ACA04
MSETLDDVAGEAPDGEASHWLFLVDPAWKPPAVEQGAEAPMPPRESVVGGWLVGPDGETGRFHSNPDYVPASPDSPTDPVDATLQLVAEGSAPVDDVLSLLRDNSYGVAVDEEGVVICVPAPDDVMSMLVTTAPARRADVERVAHWREVTAGELADLVTRHQVDLLINPAGPATIRLIGEVFVEHVTRAAARPEPVPGG